MACSVRDPWLHVDWLVILGLVVAWVVCVVLDLVVVYMSGDTWRCKILDLYFSKKK